MICDDLIIFKFRKRVEMNVWDLDGCAKIWTAKPVSISIFPHYILNKLAHKFFVCKCMTYIYSDLFDPEQPPKNSLGIFTPTWFTSATFLSKDDHRKFVAGTNSHEVTIAYSRMLFSYYFQLGINDLWKVLPFFMYFGRMLPVSNSRQLFCILVAII